MKKNLLLVIQLFFLSLGLYAQTAFYDARKLSSFLMKDPDNGKYVFDASKHEDIWVILKRHIGDKTVKDEDIITHYKDADKNPFFSTFFTNSLKSTEDYDKLNKALNVKSALSAVGGLDVTNVADGLAKFIVKRAKQELTTAFFKKFENDIETIPELQKLFPQTFKALKLIDKDIYQFNAYMNLLRESFAKDLSNEPQYVEQLINDPSFQYYNYLFKEKPERGTAVRTGFYLVNQLGAGKQPGEVLAGYNADGYINLCEEPNCTDIQKKIQTDLRSSIKVVQLFSSSFSSKSKENYWVPADSIRMLLADPLALQIYFGLIYQQTLASKIEIGETTLADAMKSLAKDYTEVQTTVDKYKVFLSVLSDRMQAVSDAVSAARPEGGTKTDADAFYRVFRATVALIGSTEGFMDLPYVKVPKETKERLQKDYANLAFTSNLISDLYMDVRSGRYSSLVMDAVMILDTLAKDKTNDQVLKKLFKYGSFMAAVTQAKSSDEVESAIEAIALPAGSFRIKREAATNISINAYAGFFVGGEQVTTLDKSPVFAYGITAPVGVAFSTSGKCGFSHSLFLSVIDLGALASFRLTNDSVSQVPTIKLQNILSPGLFYSLGLKNLPLSINLGAQIGPNLREVTAARNNYADNLYWRFSAGLVVDIPLLNIKTRPRD